MQTQQKIARGYAALNAFFAEHERASRFLSFTALILILLAGLGYLGAFMVQMSRGSMWIDEIGNQIEFVQEGPLYVVTNYPMPRNHIFYNLILSVLPIPEMGNGYMDTFLVRLPSYLIALTTGGLMLGFFLRRNLWLGGATAIGLWAFRTDLIQLSLHQRGYTLLCLLTLLAAIFILKHQETRRYKWFLALCVVCGLGIYTVPSFVLLAAPLMLLSWLTTGRDYRGMITAALTALTVFCLYLPVLQEMLNQAVTYTEQFGRQYADANAVFQTLGSYVWPGSPPVLLLLLGLVLVAPFGLYAPDDPEGRAIKIFLGSGLLFLAGCLVLQTSPVRTTTCLALLYLPASGLLVARICRAPALQAATALGLVAWSILIAPGLIGSLRVMPYENWQFVHQLATTSLPPGSIFNLNDKALGMQYYFAKDDGYLLMPEDSPPPDEPQFATGRFAVVTGRWGLQDEPGSSSPRFEPEEVAPEGFEMLIPGSFRRFYLAMNVPPQTLIGEFARLPAGPDPGETPPPLLIRPITLKDNRPMPVHSLNLLFEKPDCFPGTDPPRILVRRSDDPQAKPVTVEGLQAGRFVTFPLDHLPVHSILIHITPGGEDCLDHLQNAWFQPKPKP